MRLILAIRSLAGAGGTESHIVTVADHLQRTGHDVYVFSAADGISGDAARAHGLRVLTESRDLPADIDVICPQDAISALDFLETHPDVPQVYNWHSEYFDVQLPPQLDDVISLNVVLHADAYRRVRSLAVKTPVLQLTHPIDTMKFRPLSVIRQRPRTLLALGNYLSGEQERRLRSACDIAGIEFRHVGRHGEGVTGSPELAINDADIVAGKSKVILEAMACGRAAYVYDQFGNDGWVTPDSYGRFESNCFAGRTSSRTLTEAQIAEELGEYDQGMGEVNRALVVERHSAMTHVGLLVGAIEPIVGARDSSISHDSASELGRLARTSWRHESHAYRLALRLHEQSESVQVLQQRADALERDLAATRAKLRRSRQQLKAMTGSRRWTAMQRLMAPWDRLRRTR